MESEKKTIRSTPGRLPNGLFAPGNKLGGANPYGEKVAKFRKALFASVGVKDIKEVVASLLNEAKGGSHKHQQLLFDLLGLRVKQVEVSTDQQPVKAFISVDVDKV